MSITINEVLFGRLSADSGVSALISSDGIARIWHNKPPQNPTFPYITYEITSGAPEYHLNGQSTLVNSQIELNIWAKSTKDLTDINKAVRASLSALRGTINDVLVYGVFLQRETDFYETDLQIHRISADYFFHYKES